MNLYQVERLDDHLPFNLLFNIQYKFLGKNVLLKSESKSICLHACTLYTVYYWSSWPIRSNIQHSSSSESILFFNQTSNKNIFKVFDFALLQVFCKVMNALIMYSSEIALV